MSLAEIQRAMRDALVDGNTCAAETAVGSRWSSRLAIHRRNYEASLVTAVMGRFPATEWLIGSAPLYETARAFVHANPPSAPCIAEYAQTFPVFLSVTPSLAHLPFLRDFAELDWHLGRIAVAVDDAAPEGVHRLSSSWPVDRLMARFLDPDGAGTDDTPIGPERVWLELRGARGSFTFTRLTAEESHDPALLSA